MKIVLVDRHPLYLFGVRQFLNCYSHHSVAASYQNGREALEALHLHRPEILLTNHALPDIGFTHFFKETQNICPSTRVVLLTEEISKDMSVELLQLGVHGVLLKTMHPNLLLQCLKKVEEGGIWLEKETTNLALSKLLDDDTVKQQQSENISRREMQLLRLAANGMDNQSIAQGLFISEGTVKSHLHRIYRKLDVKSRFELSILARKNGWI